MFWLETNVSTDFSEILKRSEKCFHIQEDIHQDGREANLWLVIREAMRAHNLKLHSHQYVQLFRDR
jgi:hypothetical protein